MNLIKDNEVSTEDANLAEKPFGTDIGGIKSKTTRAKPAPVTSQEIETPKELININEKITSSIDQMKKNGVLF